MDYISEAKRLRPLIERAVQSLPDAEALEAVTLYPHWQEDVLLVAGQRVQYEGVLYVALTNHRTQAAWTPAAAPSLLARVLRSRIPIRCRPGCSLTPQTPTARATGSLITALPGLATLTAMSGSPVSTAGRR